MSQQQRICSCGWHLWTPLLARHLNQIFIFWCNTFTAFGTQFNNTMKKGKKLLPLNAPSLHPINQQFLQHFIQANPMNFPSTMGEDFRRTAARSLEAVSANGTQFPSSLSWRRLPARLGPIPQINLRCQYQTLAPQNLGFLKASELSSRLFMGFIDFLQAYGHLSMSSDPFWVLGDIVIIQALLFRLKVKWFNWILPKSSCLQRGLEWSLL